MPINSTRPVNVPDSVKRTWILANSTFIRGAYRRLEPRQNLFFALVITGAVVIGIAIAQGILLLPAALVVGALVLLAPIPVAFGAFAMLVPFDSVLALGESGKGRTLTWVAGAGVILILGVVGLAAKRLERPPRAAWYWVLFLLWGSLSSFWALDRTIALTQIPTLAASVALYFVSVSVRMEALELRWIMLLTMVGGSLASLLTIFGYYSGYVYEGVTGRASLIIGGRETNPNAFAIALLLPLSLSIGCLLSTRRTPMKLLMFAVLGVILFAVLYTMSRGALLSLLVVLLVHFYRAPQKKRFWPIPTLLLVAVSLMPVSFYQRLQTAAESRGAGRVDIWEVGWLALKNSMPFGAGLNNFAVIYTNFAGYATHFEGFSRVAHDMYLSVAVELGVLGLFLFLAAMISQFRAVNAAYKRTRNSSVLLVACEAACWGLLVAGFFADALWYKAFWLSWILLSIVTRLHEHHVQEPQLA